MKRRIMMIPAMLACVGILATSFGCGKTVDVTENGNLIPSAQETPAEREEKDSTSVPEEVKTEEPEKEVKISKTMNLMQNTKVDKELIRKHSENTVISDDFIASQRDFAVKLLQTQYAPGKNTMVSPISAMLALSMTANGADKATLSEMEKVLGSGMSIEELDKYLAAYVSALDENDRCKMNIANSIWFLDDEDIIKVRQEFLDANAKYFASEIYKAPFNDATKNDINSWVKTNTDGMIEKILEEIRKDDVMYLINAIAFDSEWAKIYEENQINKEGKFTNADGKKSDATMMRSEESLYIHDDDTTGFIKYYAGNYAFIALLPDEGVSIDEYIKNLTADKLKNLISSEEHATVYATMPSFETECSFNLNEGLISMGMPSAFSPMMADFTKMFEPDGNGNVSIDRVIQKTYIKVDGKGTKAGAATMVGMMKTTSVGTWKPSYRVDLDRPFVYMIVDTDNYLPLFFGVECDVNVK